LLHVSERGRPAPAQLNNRKRPRLFWRTIKTALLTFALLLGVGLGYLYVSNGTFRETLSIVVRGDYSTAKAFPGVEEINILIIGRDVDRDRRGSVINTYGRADAIMLAHLNFADKTANLLSIPRDTLVHIPGYRGKHKINAANAYGGPELAVDTVAQFLGVRPDVYVALDYEGFVKVIDHMGGLDIKVGNQLDYDDNWGKLHIHLKPGLQRLDGYQCMGFVRYRKSNNGHADSDVERIARQQEFVRAAKRTLTSPSALIKGPQSLRLVREHLNSALSYKQMLALMYFVKQLSQGSIRMETLPNEQGRVFVKADEDATRELVRRMFY